MIDNGYAFGWVEGPPPPPQPPLGLGKGALFAVGHGALQGVWGGGGRYAASAPAGSSAASLVEDPDRTRFSRYCTSKCVNNGIIIIANKKRNKRRNPIRYFTFNYFILVPCL